jgi:hypothetical protein
MRFKDLLRRLIAVPRQEAEQKMHDHRAKGEKGSPPQLALSWAIR